MRGRAAWLLTSVLVVGGALAGCGSDDDDDGAAHGGAFAAAGTTAGSGASSEAGESSGNGPAAAGTTSVAGNAPGGAGSGGSAGTAGSAGATQTGGGGAHAAAGSSATAGAAAAEGGSAGTAGSSAADTAGTTSGSAGVTGTAGSSGTAGFSGSAGAAAAGTAGGAGPGPEGQSCASMSGTECNGESCCASVAVPGGSYPMGRGTEDCDSCVDGCPSEILCIADERPEHTATVSRFALDKYEVTVGRFRAFVEAGAGTQESPPAAGDGAHPAIEDSGWDSAWNPELPADRAGLVDVVTCAPNRTWTDDVGDNEQYPMNCVSWYEAFAFCIWDGGRLPTEAEWEYAAAGGDENRSYPWGDDETEPLPANYVDTDNSPLVAVGSHLDGNGRWGHADLAGSLWEWVLDWYADNYYWTTESGCRDCANLTAAIYRVTRSGHWGSGADRLRAVYRSTYAPTTRYHNTGWRCSRAP